MACAVSIIHSLRAQQLYLVEKYRYSTKDLRLRLIRFEAYEQYDNR